MVRNIKDNIYWCDSCNVFFRGSFIFSACPRCHARLLFDFKKVKVLKKNVDK